MERISFLCLGLLIFIERSKNTPNAIIIIPPTWLRPSTISPVEFESTLLITTPKVENTTENPRTKNTEFKTMLVRFIVIVLVPFASFWFNSESVVPEIYARNAGIIGKIHGATKDPNPARTATASVISATH